MWRSRGGQQQIHGKEEKRGDLLGKGKSHRKLDIIPISLKEKAVDGEEGSVQGEDVSGTKSRGKNSGEKNTPREKPPKTNTAKRKNYKRHLTINFTLKWDRETKVEKDFQCLPNYPFASKRHDNVRVTT